jgi:uncharacterized protein YdhG (YjbR/CyaY superfamily)
MGDMRKTRSGVGHSAAKGSQPPKNVDEYMDGLAADARSALTKIRTAIRAALPPDAIEVISYRMPAYKRKRVLVWYAAFSDHCSLFPTAAVIEKFSKELKGFSKSKGTIHFPLDKALPTALIKRLVKARVRLDEGAGAKRYGKSEG